MKTHDCQPELTDRQVIDFCRHGYLVMERAVSDKVCRRIREYLDAMDSNDAQQPNGLLEEDWFVEGLVLNPQTAGAVRSLLGANFSLPDFMANHRGRCPEPHPLGWHVDGGNMHTYTLNYLQVFCMPQDTTADMGPTELLPGSHFLLGQSALVTHYGAIKGVQKMVGPAGTVVITCYPIWHRRTRATASGMVRHLLKYHYSRNTPPVRDWVVEPDYDPGQHPEQFNHLATGAPLLRRNFLDSYDAAHMYMWLCGREDEFQYLGGSSWPGPMPDRSVAAGPRYGIPPSLRSSSGGKASWPDGANGPRI